MPPVGNVAETAPLVVVVMGVSGSGKSTLGALLSQALGAPFLEGDAFHDAAAVAKMRAGTPLCDEDRWPWLERLGHAAGQAARNGGMAVVACSALKRSYRDRLRKAIAAPTRFVLLDYDRDALTRRMLARRDHYMPASLLESQLATLERPGSDEDALHLDLEGSACALLATLQWLEQPNGVDSGQQPLAPFVEVPAHR